MGCKLHFDIIFRMVTCNVVALLEIGSLTVVRGWTIAKVQVRVSAFELFLQYTQTIRSVCYYCTHAVAHYYRKLYGPEDTNLAS